MAVEAMEVTSKLGMSLKIKQIEPLIPKDAQRQANQK